MTTSPAPSPAPGATATPAAARAPRGAGLRTARGRHKYQTVRAYLVDLIENELREGDAVPSERALTERFGISRMTVRQALEALVADGVLQREQGRGTFVAPRRIDFEMRLTTFAEDARRRGMIPGTRVLDAATVPAVPRVAEELALKEGDPVHRLERLRTADGEPMSLEVGWIPAHLVPGLLDDGVPESIYGALRSAGLAPTWGEDTFLAAEATDAEAALLELRGSRAVLRTRRRTYADVGAVMYSQACYRGDRYSVVVPLREPRPVIVPRPREQDEPADTAGRTSP
ncbi:GntR family transcriptional regulator [Xylanimonas oleitrophica]|uniref:GntR family transcriptional regulator n=1 Tax=Xylanimonas oleitrophica TaxID=2607479 RepID=A0A2W5WPG0_9MICO|nr:GntR family transcriptional regulator [Xylanimonas oleitrophica]PZR53449.1 GntR family transcriptional regulator [Xylanimonas oleitrophica]